MLRGSKHLQRHVIFRTRCTINKRACDVIMESESSKNVVSKGVVKVMRLPIEKHLNPYKVRWIKKGDESQVTKTYKVSLSISKFYQDVVVACDVLEMNACHVLLGRSWQFDRDTLHKGKDNTCLFVWKNKKIVLVSQAESKHSGEVTPNKPMLLNISGSGILQEIKFSEIVLALMVKEVTPCLAVLSFELETLLQSFKILLPKIHLMNYLTQKHSAPN